MSRRETHAIAIPAFQAERTVGDVVRRSLAHGAAVLVIDDGSTDRTSSAAADAGARVVRHDRNRGKGRALRTAFDELFGAGYEHVVTLDADGQHLPETIPALLARARAGDDLVIGSRDHLFAGMHPVRRTSNACSSYVISAVAGRPLRDVQSGFRVYSRRLIETIGFPEARFEAESAALVRAVRYGFGVSWVPIELGFVDGRSTSHYRPLVDSLRIAVAVTRARLETVGCPVESRW